ncbi:MAG: radical SAM protein [Pseudomonadota bacterium]
MNLILRKFQESGIGIKSDLLPPRFMFMEVNKRCNLKCTHCDFWMRNDDDRANYLTLSQKENIIGEFAHMSPRGSLVICGGEPMLDLEEYFGMCAAARDKGIRVLSVVNGTRIRTAEMADRMVLEGPHEISISLNSHDPEIHDKTRGVKGAFERAVRALRLLCEARDRNPQAKSRIIVMGLIFKSNYKLIEEFYDFVLNDIGVNHLKLNFLQPSFGALGDVDRFFEDEGEIDQDEMMKTINRCDKRFNLQLNPAWKQDVSMYFDSLSEIDDRINGWQSSGRTKKHICNTYDRNIMVNHYGMARLCFASGFEGKQLEQSGDLTEFWYGAENIRRKMRKCNAFCGISHSVRKESSTVQGRHSMDDFVAANASRRGKRPTEYQGS